MVTWNPLKKVTDDGEIESDDCEVTVELLPTRCMIDQRAVTFVRAFFHGEESDDDGREKWDAGLHVVPPPRFRAFRVKPWRLKVDYNPIELNVKALRDGSLVELINVSPIDGMVITLSQVSVDDVIGFGSVLSGLLSSWVQEICATQLHKFLANARPFEPISDVGQGVTDLVILPYEAFKNGDDVRRALQSGVKSLAETVIFQTLATTSRLTHYAASTLAGTVSDRVVASNPLPSRPFNPPRGVQDVTGHVAESLARGIQAANYRVVIVPYREYSRRGATGAASSIIKGIPVLLVAPLTGATEALSYTLLGARNALRPDLRREEEATRSGFNSYDA
jgi:autophagy-related protein 2